MYKYTELKYEYEKIEQCNGIRNESKSDVAEMCSVRVILIFQNRHRYDYVLSLRQLYLLVSTELFGVRYNVSFKNRLNEARTRLRSADNTSRTSGICSICRC
jgi:hypothetical protein